MNPALPNTNKSDNLRKGGEKFADLHLHTLFSDGTYSPEALVEEAAKNGLAAIAVVDHDTVEGVASAIEQGRAKQVEVLPGLELSAEYDGLEVHLLGYLIDYQKEDLLVRLADLKKKRVERVYKILERLKEYAGIDLDASCVFKIAAGTVGRLHIARAMVAAGKVSSQAEAFKKYIGDKCPAYFAGFKFSPKEAIKLIKDAGGVAVLAHPYSLHRDELIPEFVDCGLGGLEVYYPEHSQGMVNFYLELAKKFALLVTGGSDCHGLAKPEVKIGSVKIPYELVEKLKQAGKINPNNKVQMTNE